MYLDGHKVHAAVMCNSQSPRVRKVCYVKALSLHKSSVCYHNPAGIDGHMTHHEAQRPSQRPCISHYVHGQLDRGLIEA